MAHPSKILAAFDAGAGARGVSYARNNPHVPGSDLYAAWDRGWDHTDRELTPIARGDHRTQSGEMEGGEHD